MMKTIQQIMIEDIYEKADLVSKGFPVKGMFTEGDAQVCQGDYFITLEQLETILKSYEE